MKKKILKTIKWILIVIITVLIVSIIWNFICTRVELSKVKGAYGQVVSVKDKDMVVSIKGEEEKPVIILLPGWGSASPVLEFEPLAARLSEFCQVVTIEPFGYGLSDGSKEKRGINTIVEELHECVQKLGYTKYYLMAHSISGIYSLYWANKYPEEVQGFIGIDPSVPKQSDNESFITSTKNLNILIAYLSKAINGIGFTRLISIGNPQKATYADITYPYTDKEWKVFRILSIDCMYNATAMREMKLLNDNLEVVRDMKFPESIPVLEFVSRDNCESISNWEQLHRDTITNTEKSEVIQLDGGHYLHFERLDEIIQKVKLWIAK